MSRSFRRALPEDLPGLVELQAAYYAEDDYPFEEEPLHRAWESLLGDERLGRVWVASDGPLLIAYVVLTLGFSLEYRGLDGFVDELYVAPAWRGRGLGRKALEIVDTACRELGVRALHLEVERDKDAARALYGRLGFVDHGRVLMTKRAGRNAG